MKKGIKPGFTNDDMNVDFPDVDPPFNGGDYTLSGGTNYDGTYFKYLIPSTGNYTYNDPITMSGSDTLLVKSNVFATVFLTANVDMSGTAKIVIEPGATLRLYCSGTTVALNGNGVMNLSGNATNFGYFGLPSNKEVSFGGNALFIGTIYAPQAALVLNGGGSSDFDICGASVTGTVQMKGHFHFHYDEALNKFGPFRRYIVTRWDEMPPSQVSTSAIDSGPTGVID
jgi:hypothetical protein